MNENHCNKCGEFKTVEGECTQCDGTGYGAILPERGKSIEEKPKTKKRRITHTSEVRLDAHTYEFPTDIEIKMGNNTFNFSSPIRVNDVITIFDRRHLKEQFRISKNYKGIGRPGEWSKRGGNAKIELYGKLVDRQIHWYENSNGAIVGIKIKFER